MRILVPMVTNREEIVGVRRRLARLAGKLREEGHEIADPVPLGERPGRGLSLLSWAGLVYLAGFGLVYLATLV